MDSFDDWEKKKGSKLDASTLLPMSEPKGCEYTYKSSRQLGNRETLLSKFSSGFENLAQLKFPAAKTLYAIHPARSSTGDSDGVHAVHGNLAALSVGDFKILAHLLKSSVLT